MRHIPDGMLRRLDDEPLAVPDRVTDHLAGCGRCRDRRTEIAGDTERAARLFSAPQLVPQTDAAWARLERELHLGGPGEADGRRRSMPVRRRVARFPQISLRAGLVIGAVGVVIGGTAAAASLTTIFAPTRVAPVSLSRSDVRAISAFFGLGNGQTLGGFDTPDGTSTLRFGTITWSSSAPHPASSLADASAQAGIPVTLPAHLPAGVGAVQQYSVQPHVSANVTFNSTAGSLAGSALTLDAGPGVAAEYAGTGANSAPTLAVLTMRRPTASSTGASLSQIEAFLLGQPGISPELAEEIRLLGNLRTILPVPVPSGASVHSVQVGGWPGVLLADSSNAVAGVVWEDGGGMLHAVAGLLDPQDVLNVARQIG